MEEKNQGQSVSADLAALGELLKSEILKRDCSDEEKAGMLEKLRRFREARTSIVLVGATGSGKSSTINALFSCGEPTTDTVQLQEVAKVGTTPDPETSEIEKYTIGNLILWDTPGLGDSAEQDLRSKEAIQELLEQVDDQGQPIIDLILVVMDASSKDLGTTYNVLNDIIIPSVEDVSRILVVLNQADIAMKHGRHWDYQTNSPDGTLQAFLEDKVQSVKERIMEDSNVEISPIYYSAGYRDDDEVVVYPYNMSKLLYYIVDALPAEKRIPVLEGLNNDEGAFAHNDDEMDYGSCVEESIFETISDMISDGVETGSELGGLLLGVPGRLVGGVIGGAVGTVGGCIVGILNFLENLF